MIVGQSDQGTCQLIRMRMRGIDVRVRGQYLRIVDVTVDHGNDAVLEYVEQLLGGVVSVVLKREKLFENQWKST